MSQYTRTTVKLTDFNFESMSLERLKDIYAASTGFFPSGYHENNRNHYVGMFERRLKFGHKLMEFNDSPKTESNG